MDKSTALKNLDNCVAHYENFNTNDINKAIVMGDQKTLDVCKSKYQGIMAKKQMYIDQVNAARDDKEIATIIGSVNLSDVVS